MKNKYMRWRIISIALGLCALSIIVFSFVTDHQECVFFSSLPIMIGNISLKKYQNEKNKDLPNCSDIEKGAQASE